MPSTNIKHKLSRRVLSKSPHKTYATQLLFLCGLLTSFVYVLGASVIGSIGSVYAENGTASDTTTVTLNLTSAISIRTLDSTAASEIEALNLELTPTPSGRFVKNTTQVDVSTSNPSGYKLYIQSEYIDSRTSTTETPVYTTDMLHNDVNINDKISNLTSTSVSEAAFLAASTSTSPNANVNHWGYSLTNLDEAGTYNPIPAYNTASVIREDVTSAVEHSYTPVTIGANVDTTIASGTYTNRLVFSTIVNPPFVGYSLKFNANVDGQGGASIDKDDGNDGTITAMPSNITERVMATSYTITIPGDTTTGSNVPIRPDYVFRGWNTKPDGTGTTYQPGDRYSLMVEDLPSQQVETASATLYAMWTRVYTYAATYNCNSGSGCPSNFSVTATDANYTYTIPATAPTRVGYSFTGYLGSDGVTYQAGSTVTLSTTKLSVTLTAQWSINYYTVDISLASGMTASPAALNIAYGGTETFTFSPKQGYYLSSLVCPSGYTCTGYTRVISDNYNNGDIVTQTVTVKNVNTASGGTITIGQALATWSDSSGKEWTYKMGNAVWASASSLCPNGWRLPTENEYLTMIGASGPWVNGTNTTNIARVRAAWGTPGKTYWSSTSYNSGDAWNLDIDYDSAGSGVSIGNRGKTKARQTACTK